jgi:hypothetical protein
VHITYFCQSQRSFAPEGMISESALARLSEGPRCVQKHHKIYRVSEFCKCTLASLSRHFVQAMKEGFFATVDDIRNSAAWSILNGPYRFSMFDSDTILKHLKASKTVIMAPKLHHMIIRSRVLAFSSKLEPVCCFGVYTNRIRDDFVTSTPKLPKFSEDQTPSPGHSREEREWKQIQSVTVIKNSTRCLSTFLEVARKWDLTSGKSPEFWGWC